MGMKYLMCEILCDEQKEIIKSLEILIKSKNKTILEKVKELMKCLSFLITEN